MKNVLESYCDGMPSYVRTYTYPFAFIAVAVRGNDRSDVNLKQCSKRGLNYDKENGLAYVSTTYMNIYVNYLFCKIRHSMVHILNVFHFRVRFILF